MLATLFSWFLAAINLGLCLFLLILANRAVKALEASTRAQKGIEHTLQQIAQNFRKSNEEN